MTDYLWDRSGRDPELEQLEELLARYQPGDLPLVLPETARKARKPRWPVLSIAAAGLAAAVTAIFLIWSGNTTREAIVVTALTGTPTVHGGPVSKEILSVGDRVQTGPLDRARIRVAEIGSIEIESGSTLTLLESHPERQRFRLETGEVQVRISAPPAVFIVETPEVRAVDLGCAYRLRVGPDDSGSVLVSEGWVEMDRGFEQTLVPAGAAAEFSGDRISPAYMQHTTPAFRDGMLDWWRTTEPKAREAALNRALSTSTRQDAFTLLNMLKHALRQERPSVYDRLNELVPAPREVSRTAVLEGDANASEAWWPVVERALGLSGIKKKGPLRLDRYLPR